MGRLRLMLLACFALALAAPSAASAVHNEDRHSKMGLEFQSPNEARATSSDLAFWGDRAYVGHYGGFRIFDVSNPAAPAQIGGRECSGSQNDPVVWENRLLFLAVDRTLSGPGCDATPTAEHDDPNGWEGVRIFDVSDPANPQLLKSVYTDCGAHTITMFPKNPGQLLLYVSSYPLRPGPTCGPTRGPEAGNSPLHEKISVIRVPVNSPESARVVAEPPISYPGDPDNKFDPSEHDFAGFNPLTACHDIAVFVQLRLAAGACAEQAQLWRIKSNGLPDTANPLWVFDDSRDTDGPGGGDVAVDFWHSATFNWSGTVVNFIDESFGSGCPPVTNVSENGPTHAADTGRMFFLSTRTGEKFSDWYIPRSETAEGAYCSAHLGNVVASGQRDLLVNAWYMGGVNVVDFTDPRNPTEVAYYDMAPFGIEGSDNWSAYWYEGPSFASGGGFPVYATDGVHAAPPALTKKGFQVFRAALDVNRERLPYLNPQTQEDVIPAVTSRGKSGKTKSSSSRASKARASKARASKARKAKRAKRARYDRRAARAGVLKRLG